MSVATTTMMLGRVIDPDNAWRSAARAAGPRRLYRKIRLVVDEAQRASGNKIDVTALTNPRPWWVEIAVRLPIRAELLPANCAMLVIPAARDHGAFLTAACLGQPDPAVAFDLDGIFRLEACLGPLSTGVQHQLGALSPIAIQD